MTDSGNPGLLAQLHDRRRVPHVVKHARHSLRLRRPVAHHRLLRVIFFSSCGLSITPLPGVQTGLPGVQTGRSRPCPCPVKHGQFLGFLAAGIIPAHPKTVLRRAMRRSHLQNCFSALPPQVSLVENKVFKTIPDFVFFLIVHKNIMQTCLVVCKVLVFNQSV